MLDLLKISEIFPFLSHHCLKYSGKTKASSDSFPGDIYQALHNRLLNLNWAVFLSCVLREHTNIAYRSLHVSAELGNKLVKSVYCIQHSFQ